MEEIAYIKLSELSRKIEQVFRQNFSSESYWIIAEVSGHKFYPDSDRHYFDLVEKSPNSEVEVAKFKSKSWSEGSANILNFEKQTAQTFQSGIQVLIKVKVEYHSLYGLSLTLIDIDPSFTLGNIEKQRRNTLLKLVNDNPDFIKLVDDEYQTKNKSIPLSEVIQNIALIASPNSEGYSDFIHTINNNQYGYKYRIDNYFSSVQGKDAEGELINTLINIYQSEIKYDCVVMIRGGGAKTDFLVFDTYNLSRAVAKFPIPIITGIGHHKDVSIVDLMAHSPTKTPTKCAEFILSINKKFEDKILDLQNSLLIKTQQWLSTTKARMAELQAGIIGNVQNLLGSESNLLSNTNTKIVNGSKDYINEKQQELIKETISFTQKPQNTIQRKAQTIEHLNQTLTYQAKKLVLNKSSEINHYVKVMKLMSPENILRKGFAILSVNDKIIVDSSDISEGNNIKINMYQTEIEALVTKKKKTDGKEFNI